MKENKELCVIGVDSLLSYPVKVEESRSCVGREPRDVRTVRSLWNSEVSGTSTRSNGLQRERERGGGACLIGLISCSLHTTTINTHAHPAN